MKSIDEILAEFDDIPEPPKGLMEDSPMGGLMAMIEWCEEHLSNLSSLKPEQRVVKFRLSRYHSRLLEIYQIRYENKTKKEKPAEPPANLPVVVLPVSEPEQKMEPEKVTGNVLV